MIVIIKVMKPGFWGKNVDITNVDRFIAKLQKDTLFKTVNNEIIYPV